MQGWTWDSITRLDIGIVEKRAPGIIDKDRHVDPHIFWMQPSGTARCPTQCLMSGSPVIIMAGSHVPWHLVHAQSSQISTWVCSSKTAGPPTTKH